MFNFKWEGVGARKRWFAAFSGRIKYMVGKMNLSFPLPWGSHMAFLSSHEPSATMPGIHSFLLPYLQGLITGTFHPVGCKWLLMVSGQQVLLRSHSKQKEKFQLLTHQLWWVFIIFVILILQSRCWACGFWRTSGILGEPLTRKVFPTSSRCLGGKQEKSLVHLRKHQVFKVIWNPLSVSVLDSKQAQ